jgi:protein-S-isoprenylcysteine O-methyltransferase Ste14
LSYSLAAKRLRLPLGFILGVAYLLLAPGATDPLRLAVGGAIAFVGLLVRAWASGHIMKNDRLATTGPYAHTRNPLYFGSFLIGAGFAVAAHVSLVLVVVLFWLLVYAPTMERERRNIRGRFPDAYDEYERNVPAFFPRPTPWRGPGNAGHVPWSFELYMKHGEWKAALAYAFALAWLFYFMRHPIFGTS